MLVLIIVFGLVALLVGAGMFFVLSFTTHSKWMGLSVLVGIAGMICFIIGLYLMSTPIPLEGTVTNKFRTHSKYYIILQTDKGIQQKRISVDLYFNTEIDDDIILMVDR